LINSKDNIELLEPNQSFDGRRYLLLDSGIVGETAPMVNIFMENLKDKVSVMLKNQFVKIH
jgi:mevalonate kinase